LLEVTVNLETKCWITSLVEVELERYNFNRSSHFHWEIERNNCQRCDFWLDRDLFYVPEVMINLATEGVILTKFDTSLEKVGKMCNFT